MAAGRDMKKLTFPIQSGRRHRRGTWRDNQQCGGQLFARHSSSASLDCLGNHAFILAAVLCSYYPTLKNCRIS
jgi:hypothetical protein